MEIGKQCEKKWLKKTKNARLKITRFNRESVKKIDQAMATVYSVTLLGYMTINYYL